MSSKQSPGDSGAKKSSAPVFGKQSSKDILADASGSCAKSPYSAARPQPVTAARGGSQTGEFLPAVARQPVSVFWVSINIFVHFSPPSLTLCPTASAPAPPSASSPSKSASSPPPSKSLAAKSSPSAPSKVPAKIPSKPEYVAAQSPAANPSEPDPAGGAAAGESGGSAIDVDLKIVEVNILSLH